jgi:hypothetical protein
MEKLSDLLKVLSSKVTTTVMAIASLTLAACSQSDGVPAAVRASVELTAEYFEQENDLSNMVDERFELLSLVFRLAGREEYNDADTEYQQRLASEFANFKDHKAVKYAAGLPLAYDAVFNYAVHIIKDGGRFVLLEDLNSLTADGRWRQRTAAEFIALLNDFYSSILFTAPVVVT